MIVFTSQLHERSQGTPVFACLKKQQLPETIFPAESVAVILVSVTLI